MQIITKQTIIKFLNKEYDKLELLEAQAFKDRIDREHIKNAQKDLLEALSYFNAVDRIDKDGERLLNLLIKLVAYAYLVHERLKDSLKFQH